LVGFKHFVSLLIYRMGVAPITEKRKHRLAKKPKSNEPPPSPAVENLPLFPKPISAEEYTERRKNWLAPAGSQRERRFLEKWASQPGLPDKDRALVYAWLAKPDGFEKRNALFWHAAKKQILSPVVYDTALKRHKELSRIEWLIACLIAEGCKQDEIASMADRSLPTIEKTIASIKVKIRQEFKFDNEAVPLGEIVRWFLGL
jgi:hypothetical protein